MNTEPESGGQIDVDKAEIKTNADLYKRSVKGGAWTIMLRVVIQGLSWIRYIVLVNILGIENIGLLGVASLLMTTLQAFSQTGFEVALIQKKEDIEGHLSTAWVLGIARGLILYIALFLLAPLMALIKVPPEKIATTVNVIRVLGLSFIIGSLANIGTLYFQKELDFNKRFYFTSLSSLTSVLVTIALALVYRSVWALVWGKLTGSVMQLAFSYIFHPFRPKLEFNWGKSREMWKFGKWIMCITFMDFILANGDDYCVWFILGLPSLGLYRSAYHLAEAPAIESSMVVSQVTFPAYSKIQHDIKRLKEAYLKVLFFTAFITIPACGLIIFLAPDFANLFLVDIENLTDIIPVMQILAVQGMFRAVSSTRGPVFHAIGKPKISMHIRLTKLILMIILIYPLTSRWGVIGTAWTILIIAVVVQVPLFRLIVSVLKCTYWETIRPVFYPLIGTAAMGLSIWIFRSFVFTGYTFMALGVYLAVAVSVYIGILWIFEKTLGYDIRSIIIEQLAIITGKAGKSGLK